MSVSEVPHSHPHHVFLLSPANCKTTGQLGAAPAALSDELPASATPAAAAAEEEDDEEIEEMKKRLEALKS